MFTSQKSSFMLAMPGNGSLYLQTQEGTLSIFAKANTYQYENKFYNTAASLQIHPKKYVPKGLQQAAVSLCTEIRVHKLEPTNIAPRGDKLNTVILTSMQMKKFNVGIAGPK